MTEQLSFLASDPEAARAAGEAGMDRALNAERVEAWKGAAASWLAAQPAGRVFQADDLVAAIGLPDLPGERERPNNVVGAWFSAQSKSGAIVWIGRFGKSARIAGHGNAQRLWMVER